MDNGTTSWWKKSRSASGPPNSDFMASIFRYLNLFPVNDCAALLSSKFMTVEKYCQLYRLHYIYLFGAMDLLICGGFGMGLLTISFPSLLCVGGNFFIIISPGYIK